MQIRRPEKAAAAETVDAAGMERPAIHTQRLYTRILQISGRIQVWVLKTKANRTANNTSLSLGIFFRE